MRIRKHRPEEVNELAETIAEQVPLLPTYAGMDIDVDKVRRILNGGYNEQDFMVRVLVDEHDRVVGGCGAYASATFTKHPVTNDVFIFILPEHRSYPNAMMLINAYLEWARLIKAQLVQTTHTGGYKNAQMNLLIMRAGFEPVGTIYHHRNEEP